jgi:hypothetical protein
MNQLPRIIRYYWDGELTPNRLKHLKILETNAGIPLQKMSTDNIKSFEVPEDPINLGFYYLNASHKSDYARAYVTYYHGGGYTDVKNCPENWNKYFDELEKSNKDGIGTRQVENVNGKLTPFSEDDHRYNFINASLFVFKKRSPLLKVWLDCINQTINENIEKLKLYPGTVHPYISADAQKYGWVPSHFNGYPYPLDWMALAGVFYHAQSVVKDTTLIRMYPPQTCENGHPYR